MRLLIVLLLSLSALPSAADPARECTLPRNIDVGGLDAEAVIAACSAVFEDLEWALRPIGWAYVNRGSARLISGDAMGALEDFDVALFFDPELTDALNNRAYALKALNRTEEALTSVETALRVKPNDPNYRDTYGDMLCVNGRREEALDEMVEAVNRSDQLARSRQRVLKRAGVYSGDIDGIFGPMSFGGLRAWVFDGCPGL